MNGFFAFWKEIIFLLFLFIPDTCFTQVFFTTVDNPIKLVNSLLDSSKTLTLQGKHNAALDYNNRALIICQKNFGENDTLTANSYHQSAEISHSKKNYTESIIHETKVLNIRKNIFGSNSIEVASSLLYIAKNHALSRDFEKTNDFVDKALMSLSKIDSISITSIEYYNLIVLFYIGAHEYQKGLNLSKKTLKLAKTILGEKHKLIASIYVNITSAYIYLGKYDLAQNYCAKILQTEAKLVDEGIAYNKMGVIYHYTGDYDKAKNYFQKTLEIRLKCMDIDDPHIGAVQNNIGETYFFLRKYDKAQQYYEMALENNLLSLSSHHPNIPMIYANMGAVYLAKNQYQKALDHLFKSISLRNVYKERLDPSIAEDYNLVGDVYSIKKDYDQALSFYQKALSVNIDAFGPIHDRVAHNYFSIANLFFSQKKYTAAIVNYKKSYSTNVKVFGKHHPSLSVINNKIGLIHLNKNEYNTAIDYFDKSINILEKMKSNMSAIDSKRYYFAKNYSVFEHMAKACIAKSKIDSSAHYTHKAYLYAERGKGILLREAINNINAKNFSNIPDTLLSQESKLLKSITFLEKEKRSKLISGTSENDTTYLEMVSKLIDLKEKSSQLTKQIETTYPNYYNAKHNLSCVDIKTIQEKLLKPSQSLLEYVVGDSSIFVFLIQKDHFEAIEIKHDIPLNRWIQNMTKDGLYAYYTKPIQQRTRQLKEQSFANYTIYAQKIYDHLIKPIANKLTQDLIIIPDGLLGYVPFEALLTASPPKLGAFKAYPFLVKNHSISYSYSATLLMEMINKKHVTTPENNLLAMAPFSSENGEKILENIDANNVLKSVISRDSIQSLPGSGKEVSKIRQMWNGTALYGQKASLNEFKQTVSRYRIIHLSTHGEANDKVGDYAWLAFGVKEDSSSFDKLYAKDIYNFELNSDMVVLSACETGIGELKKGDGIISLARSFAYAGAKSIFTTLWQINDETTKDIVIKFYQYLATGLPKNQALRQAKLDFISTNSGKGIRTHPYFWAGLIGIGDMTPINH